MGGISMNVHTQARPFNGLWAIQAHFELRAKIEAFANGKSREHFSEPLTCASNCIFAKWVHSKDGLLCKDRELLDSICTNCESFHEQASQAVLMKAIGEDDVAKQSLNLGEKYSKASSALQRGLVNLHIIGA